MYSTWPGYVQYGARVCTVLGQGMYSPGPGYVEYGARVCTADMGSNTFVFESI